MGENPPSNDNKTIHEILFGIIDTLCNRFQGLTPFEIQNTPTKQVFDLWTDMIIHDRNNNENDTKSKNKINKIEWVTSKNATWH